MMTRSEPLLVETPPVKSLDELYSIAMAMEQNTQSVYERLAGEMEICRNAETKLVFQDLASQESTQINSLRELARTASAKTNVPVDEIWTDQDLRGSTAREIADNLQLLTPYRAYRLAVINKERVFEILSSIVASQNDRIIRQHTETLAQEHISQIADLRLHRRRAARDSFQTSIDQAGLNKPIHTIEDFDRVVKIIHGIIRTMTVIVGDLWNKEITTESDRVLKKLLADFDDFPGELIVGQERITLEAQFAHDHENVFSALKTLLKELESAANLFLELAESTNSEEVLLAAQNKAKRYIGRISIIHDELNV